MAHGDDTDLREAIRTVRGTWRLWLLLAVTLVICGFGLVHIYGEREHALADLAKADARATEKLAELLSFEQSRAELDQKISKLNDENKALAPLKEREAQASKAKEERAATVKALASEFEDKLKAEVRAREVLVSVRDDEVAVELADPLLFEAPIVVSKKGIEALGKVGELIAAHKDLDVEVGGHADGAPAPDKLKAALSSPWELSAVRATAVLRVLLDRSKHAPKLMHAAAYGATRPIEANATARGRARNRRIELTLELPEPPRR